MNIVGREVIQRIEKVLEFGMHQVLGGTSW
jgi:hypothetical protein